MPPRAVGIASALAPAAAEAGAALHPLQKAGDATAAIALIVGVGLIELRWVGGLIPAEAQVGRIQIPRARVGPIEVGRVHGDLLLMLRLEGRRLMGIGRARPRARSAPVYIEVEVKLVCHVARRRSARLAPSLAMAPKNPFKRWRARLRARPGGKTAV